MQAAYVRSYWCNPSFSSPSISSPPNSSHPVASAYQYLAWDVDRLTPCPDSVINIRSQTIHPLLYKRQTMITVKTPQNAALWDGEGALPLLRKFWNFIPGNATFWCTLLPSVKNIICSHWPTGGHGPWPPLNMPLIRRPIMHQPLACQISAKSSNVYAELLMI